MNQVNLRIVFWGTPDFAIPALKALAEAGYNIATVITQPDKPVGRKQTLSSSPVKTFAEQNNIKTLQLKTLKDDDAFENFKLLKPNICIVAAYGKIIPKRYLSVPKYGFINIHPSLLPKYRGPSPIQTTILNGEAETGVTIMLVDEEIDHGPILTQKPYYLLPTTYCSQAEKGLAELGAKLLIETLSKHIRGKIKPKPQDHGQATFTKMFSREDGRINWNEPAEKIYNRLRALNPEPGTWTTWNDKVINIPTSSRWQSHRGSSIESGQVGYSQIKELTPGTIISVDKKIAVATSKGYLILISLQLEGRKETDAKSFVNGHPDFLGSILE